MAYADVSDIETRLGRTFTADETANVQALLDGASAVLNKLVKITNDTEQNALLKFVCTNMVSRTLSNGLDVLGASQASMTAGPYTQSFSFATPSGDLYLTKLEKRLLGITAGYIGCINAQIDGWYGWNDTRHNCNRL
jgi:hypothetical protein